MPKKKRKAELIHYEQLKTAAGGSGSMGGGNFYAGQNVVCKIVRKEPGGYTVIIPAHNLLAFLPTQALLRAGEEIMSQFVCIHNQRVLLSARLANNVRKLESTPNIRWEEHLDDIQSSRPDTNSEKHCNVISMESVADETT